MLRVIDIETTGTDPATDKICEIASADLSQTAVTTCRSHVVNPGVTMPPQASAVHHLIDEDVSDAPLFNDVIGEHRGSDTYIAHNAAFEKAFLDDALGKPQWVCTYKCALRLWPDMPNHQNQTLRYALNLHDPLGWKRENIDPHRALSDCIVTGAIFLEIVKLAKWSDVLKWSGEPALHHKFTFGKHRGTKIIDTPRDYLDWVLKSEMDEDWKFSVRFWLQQKATANV